MLSLLLQAEIGPAALNLSDTSVGSSGGSNSDSTAGINGKAPAPPSGSVYSQPGGASSGGRRPAPPSPASRPSSKASHGRGKGTWRVEDLEGELERKIKMLEKERQAMRKETQGQHEKINKGLDSISHRVTELEHSKSWGDRGEIKGMRVKA